jgi:hypothetical protein
MRTPTLRSLGGKLNWRSFWYPLQWRALGNGWKIATGLSLITLAVLIARWPGWTLRYLRVLAWPSVVLFGLLLFRWPIHALLQDSSLEGGGVGPFNVRFGQRQAEQQESLVAALTETAERAEGLQAEVQQHLHGLRIAGAFIQIYEVQLQFLRQTRSATSALTGAAAEAWFDEATKAAVDAGAPLDTPALIGWLVDRDLIKLNLAGTYELTANGQELLGLADHFWYAPKLI